MCDFTLDIFQWLQEEIVMGLLQLLQVKCNISKYTVFGKPRCHWEYTPSSIHHVYFWPVTLRGSNLLI